MLNRDEQKRLIELSWKAIRHEICGDALPDVDSELSRLPEESPLRQPGGAFVTLTERGALRGCLGYITAESPLVEMVATLAARAATEDPRFTSVTEEELPDLHVEVSILSPLEEVSSIDEIEVGKHGLFIHAGMYRGLLLPQVAREHRWNREEFLEQTCMKAGLPPDHWKHAETRIFIFTAEIIEQEQ